MSNAGKGDNLRKGANLQAYWDNYDNIFDLTEHVFDIFHQAGFWNITVIIFFKFFVDILIT